MMKAFSLALALITVEAAEWSNQGYTTSTHYPAGGYGHGGHSHGMHSSHGHSHTHTHPTPSYNPWENVHTHSDDDDDDSVDKSTWYSPYQQYSPPKIAYKVVSDKTTRYASCEVNSTNTIQFAQIPGKPTMVRTNFSSLTADATYGFKFNEYGRAFNSCANVGPAWNPLSELDSLGRVNPYQDPTRGNIENITADSTGVIDNDIQKELLQNLSGSQSIIGRSVTVFLLDSDGAFPDTPIGCCVIGFDEQPAASSTEPDHHHHGSYGHGYGSGYGHSGHSHGTSHGHGYGSGYGSSYGGFGRYGKSSYRPYGYRGY